ncbi:MAG: cyclic nucleotide-binding domain-containing protein [Pseudomonadota bacterium]
MNSIGAAASGCAAGITRNQGQVLADDGLGFYGLADGVRGHPAGGRAAALSLEVARRTVADVLSVGRPASAETALDVLHQAVQAASAAVFAAGIAQPDERGMSTTLTLLWVLDSHAHIAHVGHSAVQMSRLGRLHRLTRDHTVAQELVALGMIQPAQAVGHPMARVLTRAIGMQEAVVPDSLSVELVPGDRFLLTAAGTPETSSPVATAARAAELARALVADTLAGPEREWANALVVDVLADAYAASGDALAKLEVLGGMFLFKDLDMSELSRVLECAVVRQVDAGATLIQEGSQDRSLYLILDGELEVIRNGVVLAPIGKGGHVGEMALVSGEPRSASVRAARPTRFLEIGQAHWNGLLHRAPAIGVKLLTAMAEEFTRRLVRMNERV